VSKKSVDWVACTARVEQLAKELRREVTPKDILRDAETNKRSPLRSYFTWDLERGFRKNLLVEARQLLSTLRVMYLDPETGESVPVRKYVRLMIAHTDQTLRGGYVPRAKAMKVDYLHVQMVELAKQNLETFVRRFRSFTRIETVFPLIQRAITMLEASAVAKAKRRAQ